MKQFGKLNIRNDSPLSASDIREKLQKKIKNKCGIMYNITTLRGTMLYIHLRYTKEFVDSQERFSICVMPQKFRNELSYCGKVSGRDEDKIAKCGFSVAHHKDVPYFNESRIVLICKKLYAQEMKAECFTNEGKNLAETFYKDNDWHVMYIAEIEDILVTD